MPEPLTDEYLRETQQIISAVPAGPWDPIPNDYGTPDAVGPISFLETASDEYQMPVIAFVGHAREALPRYVGEVSRQRAQIRALEHRVRQLEQPKDGDRRDC
ncbi:hypothetical protein [Streptomyces roseochromogenus]|uniref:Uncharacterized protein n=1 Tax=Streptomyces roseochromogenus subsp. oscitans DS 12.976 TaxID=1352936 RepID=V6JX28_STRRC|nr:hypothetical protein [Streptomyces roseochromogenus]EST24490.1 hypothetical protein M878_30455 [Streptomyces roseochromogenus subsp. oscitans DS 12.976]